MTPSYFDTDRLQPWAYESYEHWSDAYGTGNCSCHISPPCGSCTHEGNPSNLMETPEAWMFSLQANVLAAKLRLQIFIGDFTAINLAAMKEYSQAYAARARLGEKT